MKSITEKQTNENAQEYWNYNHHHKVKTPLLTCLGKDFIYPVQFIIFINNFTEFQAHIWIWWSCRIICQRAKKQTYLKQCPLTLIFIGPGRMLCGNDYFIVCHALSLFQRENFKPCSALEENFVRASTETVLSLLRTWWQISKTQNKNPQEGKNQARSLTQDLKSAVDALHRQANPQPMQNEPRCYSLANNLDKKAQKWFWFKPTEIKAGLLHYFEKYCGISWFSVISW